MKERHAAVRTCRVDVPPRYDVAISLKPRPKATESTAAVGSVTLPTVGDRADARDPPRRRHLPQAIAFPVPASTLPLRAERDWRHTHRQAEGTVRLEDATNLRPTAPRPCQIAVGAVAIVVDNVVVADTDRRSAKARRTEWLARRATPSRQSPG